MWAGYGLFWSQWRERFVETGALAPSSHHLARSMAAPLKRRPAAPIRVLEAGAGTGVFTEELLRQMHAGDRLDLYEINPRFCEYLEARLNRLRWRERGLEVCLHRDDIRRANLGQGFDFIVCGLPFNNFAPPLVAEILHLLLDSLKEGGVFSYFEYLALRDLRQWFLRSGPEHERLRAIGEIMRGVLSRHEIRRDEVWLNFPPAAAHHLMRRPSAAAVAPA